MPSIMYACIGKNVMRYRDFFGALDKYISEDGNNKITQIGDTNYHFCSIQVDDRVRCRKVIEDNLTILFSGRIYESEYKINDDEINIISDAYRREGALFANSISGPFAAIIYDHNKELFVICNDVMGLLPCYYCQKDDVMFITTEAEALVKCGIIEPQLNYNSLADLYVNGSVTGKYTLLKHVKRLLPASILTIDRGGLTKWSRNDVMFKICEPEYDINKLVEEVDSLICSAVKKITRYVNDKDLEIKLSGGLDSRFMVAHVAKVTQLFKVVTDHDPSNTDCEDIEYAISFANKFNIIHEVRLSEPEQGIRYRQLLNDMFLYDKPVMTGHWAEIIKGKPLKYRQLFNEEYSNERLQTLFVPEYIKKLTSSPYELLIKLKNEMLGGNDNANLYLQYIYQITSFFRLDVPCIHRFCNRFKTNAHLPFIDKELLLYILRVPIDVLEGGNFFIRMISELYPHLLDVPTTTIDRLNQNIDRKYKTKITQSQNTLINYYEFLKKVSPLWDQSIFTNKFKTREDYVATALFNIWYDYYFENNSAVDAIRGLEKRILNHRIGK